MPDYTDLNERIRARLEKIFAEGQASGADQAVIDAQVESVINEEADTFQKSASANVKAKHEAADKSDKLNYALSAIGGGGGALAAGKLLKKENSGDEAEAASLSTIKKAAQAAAAEAKARAGQVKEKVSEKAASEDDSIEVETTTGEKIRLFRKNLPAEDWASLKSRAPSPRKPAKLKASESPTKIDLPTQEVAVIASDEARKAADYYGGTPEQKRLIMHMVESGKLSTKEVRRAANVRDFGKRGADALENKSLFAPDVLDEVAASRKEVAARRAANEAQTARTKEFMNLSPEEAAKRLTRESGYEKRGQVSIPYEGPNKRYLPEDNRIPDENPPEESAGVSSGGMSSRMPFPVQDLMGAMPAGTGGFSGAGGGQASSNEGAAYQSGMPTMATETAGPPGMPGEVGTTNEGSPGMALNYTPNAPDMTDPMTRSRQQLAAQGPGATPQVPPNAAMDPGAGMPQEPKPPSMGGRVPYEGPDAKTVAGAASRQMKAQQEQLGLQAEAEDYRAKQIEDQVVATQQARIDAHREAQAHMEKRANLLSQYEAALNQGVDPSRYWKNQSGFQQVMGGMAAFFYGLAGPGEVQAYMNRVQAAVNTDINLQREAYENKAAGIKARIANEDNLYAQARQLGLDDLEAQGQVRAMRLSELESTMKKFSLKAQQMGLPDASILLQAQVATEKQKEAQKAQLDYKKQELEVYKVKSENYRAQLKEGGAGGAGGQKMGQATQNRFQRLAQVRAALAEMRSIVARVGTGARLWNASFGSLTDKEQADRSAWDMAASQIGIFFADSALQKEEAGRLLGAIGSKNSFTDPEARIKRIEALAEREEKYMRSALNSQSSVAAPTEADAEAAAKLGGR